jgi:glutamine amidotransferase
MQGLKERGLDKAICEFANSGRPLLGICLGMQLFATKSEEFGEHSGLGLVPGKVVAIPKEDVNGDALKIPFVGWSSLVQINNNLWNDSALASISALNSIFLVHSFHFAPENPLHVLAAYHYGGLKIVAAIKKQNITGVQFHPEKSGKVGLSILSNFINQESTENIS